MYPILGRYGPFFFYSYTAALGLGLAAGVALSIWRARHEVVAPGWLDGLLWGLLAALPGGRLAYVSANWDYFQAHPGTGWFIWQGGLSYHGALLAGLLGLAVWCLWHRQPFFHYAGLLAPAGALWSVFGWLACWLEGCAYGRETYLGLLTADLPDSYGVYAVRYQTQALGIVFSLLILLLIWRLRHWVTPPVLFWLTLFLLSGSRAIVTLFRGDVAVLLGAWRLDLLLDLALAAVSLVALFWTHFTNTTKRLLPSDL